MKNFGHLNPITSTTLIGKSNQMMPQGTSVSALNQTNSTSFSVLSNYSDSGNGTKATASHLKYPMKKSYLAFGNGGNGSVVGAGATTTTGLGYPMAAAAVHHHPLTLPKLSNSTNAIQYVQYQPVNLAYQPQIHHQSSPTMHNLFTKMSNVSAANALPDLYANGHLIESKIIGSGGSRLHSKY